MVKVIMGRKGTGKTKKLIEMVNQAIENKRGDVVVIEKGTELRYDIPHQARLVEAGAYGIDSYEILKGFLSGLHAGNYDITDVFIDSLYKVVGREGTPHEVEKFLEWLDSFAHREKIRFTIMISQDISLASEGMKNYF